MNQVHFSDNDSLAQPTRRPGMLSFKHYKIPLILTLKLPVDHHRREGLWYFEIQSTSSRRFGSVARPRNRYVIFYILFIHLQTKTYMIQVAKILQRLSLAFTDMKFWRNHNINDCKSVSLMERNQWFMAVLLGSLVKFHMLNQLGYHLVITARIIQR